MSKNFAVGDKCWCTVFSNGGQEVCFVEIVELMGVVGARVQIIGDRIIRVCQSQLKKGH